MPCECQGYTTGPYAAIYPWLTWSSVTANLRAVSSVPGRSYCPGKPPLMGQIKEGRAPTATGLGAQIYKRYWLTFSGVHFITVSPWGLSCAVSAHPLSFFQAREDAWKLIQQGKGLAIKATWWLLFLPHGPPSLSPLGPEHFCLS